MALDLTQPFQWGAGGAPMTPQAAEAQRKVAQALLAQGMDYSPIKSPWQGAARVAQALVGGYESAQADASDRKLAEMQPQMLAAALSGTGLSGETPSVSAPMGVASIPSGEIDPSLKTAISTAASANPGVDPAYMTRLALVENGGRINGGSQLSSAQGPFQFLSGTARQYNLSNPNDPVASADAAARLTLDNKAALTSALGREPTPGELYLAHQQGSAGAIKLLQSPDAPVESVIGAQAARNNAATPGMTAGQFANKWMGKFGDLVQTVDPAQKNIIDAQADSPAPMAFAGTQPPVDAPAAVAAPVAAAIPQAVQHPSGIAKIAPLISLANSPYASDATKKIAGVLLASQLAAIQKANDPLHQMQIQDERNKLTPLGQPYHDADGNLVQKDALGKVTVLSAADKTPTSVSEYKYYTDNFKPTPQQPEPMDYATFSTAKARAGATNISNNFDPGGGQTYDKQLAEGLGKAHAALANGVEDAQTRARDIAAMQGAVDAIQKNGGTTGGLAASQRLELQKSINAGAAALGISKPFSESDLSDKEFLTKFNRSMAGAQAKNAVGSRVTNFEMTNFLKANPGLDMTTTGNQRLLGIQAQIEQRNIAVGNAIRDATAAAIGDGKKIDPRTVQKIITDYDGQHHITDPVTGQDLTQSYVLPEFQSQGTNPAQAQRHEQNIGKIRRYNPATGKIE